MIHALERRCLRRPIAHCVNSDTCPCVHRLDIRKYSVRYIAVAVRLTSSPINRLLYRRCHDITLTNQQLGTFVPLLRNLAFPPMRRGVKKAGLVNAICAVEALPASRNFSVKS